MGTPESLFNSIVSIKAENLENGWVVQLTYKLSYNSIRTRGYIFKTYEEMLTFLAHVHRELNMEGL